MGTIVTQAIPTGRLGGAMTRKTGAAPTRRRAARSELAEETGSLHSAVLGPSHPKYMTGGAHLLSGVRRCLGGQHQASRFLFALAMKRDTDQGISRHITLLL